MDDRDDDLIECFSCLMNDFFYDANIVIAPHGAGLANTIPMAPGNVIIEIARYYKTFIVPNIGPFSPFDNWSMTLGFHHYMYYSKNDLFPFDEFFNLSMQFISKICLFDTNPNNSGFNVSFHRPLWCEKYLISVTG
jgi:hypothetical protein